jgi:peptidoglycan/LPS O-acetylase OafA/YrhL
MTALQKKIRRHDLDWLRALGVLLLIPFHTALVFNLDPRSIVFLKDTVHSPILSQAAAFVHLWHMPLLFFIAGASSWFALGSCRPRAYVRERAKRLLIPFLFGMLTLIPPMTYVRYLGQPDAPTFWAHYRGFFTSIGDPESPSGLFSGLEGGVTPAHLWFILFLFIYSILALPLFTWLRRPAGRRAAAGLAGFLAQPFAVLLLFIPLALADWLGILGAQNPVYYLLVFVLGYVLMGSDAMQASTGRQAPVMLAVAVGAYGLHRVLVAAYRAGLVQTDVLPGALYNLNRWAWTVTILGWGQRLLTRSNDLLRHLRASSYPIYILHLPVVTLVTHAVIRLPVSMGVKYALIVAVSTVACFGLYELVARVALLRFLLGMKAVSKRTPV